jgi:hypothetical protein
MENVAADADDSGREADGGEDEMGIQHQRKRIRLKWQ